MILFKQERLPVLLIGDENLLNSPHLLACAKVGATRNDQNNRLRLLLLFSSVSNRFETFSYLRNVASLAANLLKELLEFVFVLLLVLEIFERLYSLFAQAFCEFIGQLFLQFASTYEKLEESGGGVDDVFLFRSRGLSI